MSDVWQIADVQRDQDGEQVPETPPASPPLIGRNMTLSARNAAISLESLKPKVEYPWRSGWLGIEYGIPVHGFGEMFISPGRGATIHFWWMAGDGDVYQSVELTYVRSRARVDFYIGLQEDEPHLREESVIIPVAVRKRMRELVGDRWMYPQELFTRMVVLYVPMFQVMTPAYAENDLYWDHRWYQGPDTSDLWRPVDLGTGLAPFTILDTPQAVHRQALDLDRRSGRSADAKHAGSSSTDRVGS